MRPDEPTAPASPDLSRSQAAVAVAITLAVIATLYLVPILSHEWALADGGLFYAMVGDIIAAGFALPHTISYQHDIIPFAYPPLAFYVAAAIEELLGVARIEVFRFLPAAFTLAMVAAMYPLAAEIGPSRRHAVLSTVLFAAFISVAPALTTLIGGGGLTRTPGLLLAMLAAWQGIRMLRTSSWLSVALTALFAGLAVTTHPQAGVFLVVALAAAWLTRWRTVRGALLLVLSAAGSLLVVGPWIAIVASRHGLEPFTSASGIPDRDIVASVVAYFFLFLSLAPLLGILDLVGQLQQLKARNPHLLVWRAGVFILDIRFSPVAAAPPAAMLAAHGVLDAIVPLAWGLLGRGGRELSDQLRARTRQVIVGIVLVLVFIPVTLGVLGETESSAALSAEQREAMAWVRDNTADEAVTVTLATEEWGGDDVSEWFPALSERRTASAAQGLEWVVEVHDPYHVAQDELRACRTEADRATCLDAWIERHLADEVVVVYVDHATDPELEPALVEEHGYSVLWSNEAGTVLDPA